MNLQKVAVLLPVGSAVNLCWKSVTFRFAGETTFVSASAILTLTVVQFSKDLFVYVCPQLYWTEMGVLCLALELGW